jgi:glycosyltransferase involved in cell wall biosynthesis
MSRLNILVVSNCAFDPYQGSGYVITNTMECLRQLGHQVVGVDTTGIVVLKALNGRAIRYRLALGMASYIWKRRKTIRGFDVIIFYGAESFLAIWMLKHGLDFGGKIVLHSNGIEMQVDEAMMQGTVKVNRYAKWFQWNMHSAFRYAYRNIDLLITVSEYNAQYALESLKMQPENIRVLEPCLHNDYFENAFVEVAKEPIIMFCGGWLAIKGSQAIQYAISIFLTKFPAYRFLLVGVGYDFKKEHFFPENVLNRVEVIEYVRNRQTLIAKYRQAEIFIFPSLADSFGIVIAEAMLCQTPVITSKVGLGYSLINEKEAIVIEQPDGPYLLKALERLAKDNLLRMRLAQQGHDRVSHLHWNAYQKQLQNIFRDLTL